MSHVEVITPAGVESFEVETGQPQGLLFGRQPDTDWLRNGPLPELDLHVRELTSTAPGISANHVVICRNANETFVMDLGSRNGTWLRLRPFERTAVHGDSDVELRLSLPTGAPPPAPADATWTSAETFESGISSAVETWLRQHKIDARVFVSRDKEINPAEQTTRLPLSRHSQINVVPTGTMSPEWRETLAVLWRYVDAQRRAFDAEESTQQEGMVLASPAIRRAHRDVASAAARGLRLLLLGPTGAGKEGLARAYHSHSGRNGPFVALNCSQLNKDLLRAELFGAEEGAFTGSVRRIVGAVEQANGGTLFLDEVGELPPDVQPMLLRFLDRGEFVRLGSYGKERRSDVLIVGATNRDLRYEVAQGRFREDLWFRLSICVVEVPGLRSRFEDVQRFLQLQRLGTRSVWDVLESDAVEALRDHAWDGNFRELSNFVARLSLPEGPNLVNEAACRRALASGSLRPHDKGNPSRPPPRSVHDWNEQVTAATASASEAFLEDRGASPASWNDIKDFIENYFKPVLFAHLSGAAEAPPGEAKHTSRLGADRGTANRQLDRYFERFYR